MINLPQGKKKMQIVSTFKCFGQVEFHTFEFRLLGSKVVKTLC